MNTRKGRAKFKNFRIILDTGCISTIVTGRLIPKLSPKEGNMMKRHTQAGSITTNLKVKIYLTLPEISATEIVTWNFHVDDTAKGRYDNILGRDLLTPLGLNLKFSDNVIEAYDGPFKESTEPMVDLGTHEFKY